MAKAVPKSLLKIICCPSDKTDLKYDARKQTLTCKKKHVYKVKDGIPVLLSK